MNKKQGITMAVLIIGVIVFMIILVVTINLGNRNVIDETKNTVNKQNYNVFLNQVKEEIRIIKMQNELQDKFFVSKEKVEGILSAKGSYDSVNFVVTTSEDTKLSLFDLGYAKISDYFTKSILDNTLTLTSTVNDSYYIMQYSIDSGSTWNTYTESVSITQGVTPIARVVNIFDIVLGEF